MESQQFHLKWNNHSLNTLSSFQHLLDTNTLVDVSLTCNNGKIVTAHRMVLAACSEYFYRLFKDLPEKHPVIVFKDATEEIVRDLLLFMYKGEVEVQESYLNDFLKFADTLQVKGLTSSDREDVTKVSTTAAAGNGPHQGHLNNNNNVHKKSSSGSNGLPSSSATSLATSSSSSPVGIPAPPPPPLPPAQPSSNDLMTKNYLLAQAAGKFPPPPLFPALPPGGLGSPAAGEELLSQLTSPNLYRALQRRYQMAGLPPLGAPPGQQPTTKLSALNDNSINPVLDKMPLLKDVVFNKELAAALYNNPLNMKMMNSSNTSDDDSIAERSPPPPPSANQQNNDDHDNNNDNDDHEKDGSSPTSAPSGHERTPGTNSSREGKGRGSRLERMIAAEYKILNEYSDSNPDVLPVMTPELMKSRRTHSLQLAIGEILHNRASVQSAATKYHIPRETLRRHYQRYLKAMGIRKTENGGGPNNGAAPRSNSPSNNSRGSTPSRPSSTSGLSSTTPTLNNNSAKHHNMASLAAAAAAAAARSAAIAGVPGAGGDPAAAAAAAAISAAAAANADSLTNSYSSLMEIGQAYGIWNNDMASETSSDFSPSKKAKLEEDEKLIIDEKGSDIEDEDEEEEEVAEPPMVSSATKLSPQSASAPSTAAATTAPPPPSSTTSVMETSA